MLPFDPAAHVLGYRMVADEDAAYGRGLPGYRVSATLSPADIRLSPTGIWVTLKDSNRADFVHQHAPAGQPRPRRANTGTPFPACAGWALSWSTSAATSHRPDRRCAAPSARSTVSWSPAPTTRTRWPRPPRLDWLARHRHASLVSDALLVLSDLTGTAAGRSGLDEAERELGPLVGSVVRIPYEAALRDDGLVDHSALGPLTREAFRKAAQGLFG